MLPFRAGGDVLGVDAGAVVWEAGDFFVVGEGVGFAHVGVSVEEVGDVAAVEVWGARGTGERARDAGLGSHGSVHRG